MILKILKELLEFSKPRFYIVMDRVLSSFSDFLVHFFLGHHFLILLSIKKSDP